MELRIGPHRIVIEEDVLVAHVSAPWLLAEMKQFLTLCEETQQRLGSVYILTVVGPGYDLPPPSRKYIGEWSRKAVITGNVIVGAPFAMRTLISIISRATQLLGAPSSGVVFMNTEAEARAWIQQHKSQRGGK